MVRRLIATLIFALGAAACASTPTRSPGITDADMAAAAAADSVRNSYSQADVDFMAGMIHHHAQALVMSRLAPTNGASDQLLIMTRRIINAQNDEIALMERWLHDHGETVPDPSTHMRIKMPGMLSEKQMSALEGARGADFDRLFLTYMIQHHQGAATMVAELFATDGAAREQTVFKLASDIEADQTSEVTRMRTMLSEILFETDESP